MKTRDIANVFIFGAIAFILLFSMLLGIIIVPIYFPSIILGVGLLGGLALVGMAYYFEVIRRG
jgi:hypothetical protein